MKRILLLTFCLFSSWAYAQDELIPGYQLLEGGKFAEGAVFFKRYLTTKDSTNRTALLCYGRGIGLAGQPTEAQAIFQKLLQRYPGDFEISLNLAESLMWAKKYQAAMTYYERLLVEKPDNFNAVLGYTNALSSLQDYAKAVEFAEKANLIKPNNSSVLISRKYARLGLADQLIKKQQYAQAAPLLEGILHDFSDDKDALFAKAQLLVVQSRYKEAEAVYRRLVLKTENQSDAYSGLSYLSFLQKDKPLALAYADKAIEAAAAYPERYLKVQLGRISALGWNEKFQLAFAELDALEQRFPNRVEVLLSRAMLSVWSKQYARGAELYQKALAQSPQSFDGNLGYADARHAEGNDTEAYAYVHRTLSYYPDQLDATQFLHRLDLAHKPTITSHVFTSRDNGNNYSVNYNLNAAFDLTTNFRLNVGFRERKVGNYGEGGQADVKMLVGGFKTQLTPFWTLSGTLGNVALQKDNTTSQQLFANITNEFKVGRLQRADIRYNRDAQTFTANLVGNNITFQNIIGSYNLATPFRLGVYSQYIHSFYSDGNRQRSLFSSLYYDLKYAPVAKIGINYQTMGFKYRVTNLYFSPSNFNSIEAFGQLENLTMPKQRLLYQISLAGGLQKIEEEAFQPTYRVSIGAGYRPMSNLELMGYIFKSNSATSTVMGYSYSEAGLKAKWVLMKPAK